MNILFICTHNRCRSILSEAITNHFAGPKITAYSAGSEPAGEVHPLTIKYLDEIAIDTQALSSQSWDEFENVDIDVVITVCDSAAKETCPLWFGDRPQLHWSLPDPSKLESSGSQVSEEDIREAFYHVMTRIEQRAKKLLSADLEHLDEEARIQALREIGNDG